MFGLLRKANLQEQAARQAYGDILLQVRRPEFYADLGVPDTQGGRFEILMLHLFMVMHAASDAAFSQALFDEAFADMDQTLRESGVGDMGVPKRMRRLMRAFNGRMRAYTGALEGREPLENALARNLYPAGGRIFVSVKLMADYMRQSLALMKDAGGAFPCFAPLPDGKEAS